jgi:hypothetical protein
MGIKLPSNKKRRANLRRHGPAIFSRPHPGIALIFAQACKLGCEGIVSKRFGSTYRSGRSKHWIKVKIASGEGLERRTDVTRNLSMRSRGFNSLPAKAQPANRKPALHGQRQRCS